MIKNIKYKVTKIIPAVIPESKMIEDGGYDSSKYQPTVEETIREDYDIIKPDGSGYNKATQVDIKHITDTYFLCDILDADSNVLAVDRRFYYDKYMRDQMIDAEINEINGGI